MRNSKGKRRNIVKKKNSFKRKTTHKKVLKKYIKNTK